MTSNIDGSGFNTNNNKFLQIVSQLFTTQSSQTTTTTDTVVGGVTTTFTSVGANSKYLIYARWFGESDVEWNQVFNIRVNGNRVNSAGATGNDGLTVAVQSYVQDDNNSTPESLSVMTLYTSTIGAGTSVTVDLVCTTGTATHTRWNNRCFGAGNEIGSCELIIYELKP